MQGKKVVVVTVNRSNVRRTVGEPTFTAINY